MSDQTEIISKDSPRSVHETVEQFTGILDANGVKVFAVIDQAAEARAVGLRLRETVLVIFGKPSAGTPIMNAVPLAALDLPLKAVIWDDEGQTRISYVAPDAIAARYGVPPALDANLRAIDQLTDAAAAG